MQTGLEIICFINDMDCKTPEERSYNMSRIKAKNTKPEMVVRKWLWSQGFRFRLYRKDLPGKPDIVLSKFKKVIFVNGCFWHHHNCEYFKWPKTNSAFWQNKINANVKRDKSNYKDLLKADWKYLVIWECEIQQKEQIFQEKILDFLV